MAEPTTYIDCSYNHDRNVLMIASSFDRFNEEEDTFISQLLFLALPGTFTQATLEGMRARSVAGNGSFIWIIGEQGEVWTYPRGIQTPIQKKLPDSGVRTKRHLGRPERIRLIEEVPYVCGYAGQVYTLSGDRWVHMDTGIVEPEGRVDSIHLDGIHGTGATDLYVVGSGGTLARWDGKVWSRISLLTDAFLAGVRAVSKKHVVGVGDNGVFVEWKGSNWSVQQIPGYEETTFSDIEIFKDKLYIAAVRKLLVQKKTGWEVVDTGLAEEPTFIRLATGGGRLWAIGAKRVYSFDGRKWNVHIDPDNG